MAVALHPVLALRQRPGIRLETLDQGRVTFVPVLCLPARRED